jgi:hypothetical protein
LLPVRSNQTSLSLTGQSQVQIKAAELFVIPDGGTVAGWMKAESVNPQLTAWKLISLGNIQGDRLDALAVSDETAQKIAFSAVFEDGDTITAFGLANPDSRAAHVKSSLYSGGSVADVREFSIPGFGHRAWFLNDLFQASVPVGHVEIESDIALAGLQIPSIRCSEPGVGHTSKNPSCSMSKIQSGLLNGRRRRERRMGRRLWGSSLKIISD